MLPGWRKTLCTCIRFSTSLATSPKSTPRRRKGGVSEYARRIGRARQTIMEWVNAAAVLKNLPDIRHLFDRTYHLAAIHAAPQELWPVFVEALLAQDWTDRRSQARWIVADTRRVSITFVDITSELARLCRKWGKRAIVKSLCLWAFWALALTPWTKTTFCVPMCQTIERPGDRGETNARRSGKRVTALPHR